MVRNLIYLLCVLILILAAACGGERHKSEKNASVGELKVPSNQAAMEIFNKKCGLCHGKDGKKQLAGAPDLSKSELTIEERIELIRNGKGVMPPFKDQLSQEEIEAVAVYLDKFKK